MKSGKIDTELVKIAKSERHIHIRFVNFRSPRDTFIFDLSGITSFPEHNYTVILSVLPLVHISPSPLKPSWQIQSLIPFWSLHWANSLHLYFLQCKLLSVHSHRTEQSSLTQLSSTCLITKKKKNSTESCLNETGFVLFFVLFLFLCLFLSFFIFGFCLIRIFDLKYVVNKLIQNRFTKLF